MADSDSYRDLLVKCRHEASQDFDKAIMTLSGGALAIAIGFLHGGTNKGLQLVWCLITSWALFGVSLFSTLFSFRMSFHAFHRAIEQVDNQIDDGCIQREGPGGRYTKATDILNWVALGALVIGVAFIGVFVAHNLGRLG